LVLEPAEFRIARIVGGQRARAREHIFRRIAASVPNGLAGTLEHLLVVTPDENSFGLQRLTLGIPYGYNSHRSRLGRDNRPKLFRKTNISNDVAGTLHPIVGRCGPHTVGLFTFLTLSDFQSFAK
jgi:hypothetical protein